MQNYTTPDRRIVFLALVVMFAAAPRAGAQWTNGQNAEYVLGEPNFTSETGGTGQNELDNPYSVAIDAVNNKLYVADKTNNRVLRYAWPVTANQPNAELVFGQSNFTNNAADAGGTVAANTLDGPYGVCVDATGRLWVADRYNNRVLWYNAAHSIASNQPNADGVLGQADFTTESVNRGGTTAVNSMDEPLDVEVDDGGRLWVADSDNDRILRFDNASAKANGANADGVLGQPDFTSNAYATTQSGLSTPYGVCIQGNSLWVPEYNNNRTVRYDNAAAKANGANADVVLGQADFTSNVGNRGGTLAANTQYLPRGVCTDGGGRLYVADSNNDRVLIYNNALAKANGADADQVLGQDNLTTHDTTIAQNRLDRPYTVAVDVVNGKLAVADAAFERVMIFSASGALPVSISSFSIE